MFVALHTFATALLAIGVAAAIPALAQDTSNRSGNRSDQNGSAGQQAEFGQPKAEVAQVGAGTTDGSTTGYSGPKDVTENKPGQIQVPPLPSPELCKPYQGTPAVYQACLWVSLKD